MASQDWIEKDFYKILGVTKGVSDADLKKSYRKLAKDNHPDLHPGDQAAESRFKDISEAYDVLSDKEQRQEYDAVRAMGGGARFQAGGRGGGGLKMSSPTCLAAAEDSPAAFKAAVGLVASDLNVVLT